ncbi:MAG: hypothetical protein U0T69_11455 [Chitinophagales bacterium]
MLAYNESIVVPDKPSITVYRDKDGGFHCDINVNGYLYGAIRHTIEDIAEYCQYSGCRSAFKRYKIRVETKYC